MSLSLLLVFLFSLVIRITADATPPQPVSPALVIALEGPNASTVLLAPTPTITVLDASTDDENNSSNNNRPTQTITQTARVIQTHRPNDPEPIIIFPFHLTLTEHCSSPSSPCSEPNKSATAIFTNGDWTTRLVNLGPDTAATVEHRIPDYPRTLRVGPYDTHKSELRFSYRNGDEWVCDWGDSEGWRVCGECRAKGWNTGTGRGECGDGDGDEEVKQEWVRTKEMHCSFIMGWKHQLHVVQPRAKN